MSVCDEDELTSNAKGGKRLSEIQRLIPRLLQGFSLLTTNREEVLATRQIILKRQATKLIGGNDVFGVDDSVLSEEAVVLENAATNESF